MRDESRGWVGGRMFVCFMIRRLGAENSFARYEGEWLEGGEGSPSELLMYVVCDMNWIQ